MYYSEDEINEILEKVNIKELIMKVVKLEKIGNKYFGLCPFHEEVAPSFMVDDEKQTYHCFGCGAGGNAINFLMEYNHISFLEALEMLGGNVQPTEDVLFEDKSAILQMNQIACNLYKENYFNNDIAKDYIKNRRLTENTVLNFQIGFSDNCKTQLYKLLKLKGFSDDLIKKSGLVGFYDNNYIQDKFVNRIMFPIQNINGNIIGFGGRILNEKANKNDKKIGPKYLNSIETLVFDKSANLFGLNFAKKSCEDYFILCEGYMDVISMHQIGLTNTIASLGTSFTSRQAQLIKTLKSKVYLSYDSDGPGISAAKRAITVLKPFGIQIKFIDLSPYKDPDEFVKSLGKDNLMNRIERALSLEEWSLKQAIEQNNKELIFLK